jgi:hypothetical protein
MTVAQRRVSMSSSTRSFAMLQQQDNERRGAIGWAFLVWLFGGGIGLAILVFIILRML